MLQITVTGVPTLVVIFFTNYCGRGDPKMKVRDLLEQLSRLDPDLEVVCYTEDEDLLPHDHLFLLLDVNHLDQVEAQPIRLNERPYFRLGKGRFSRMYAFLNVTAHF